MRQAWLEWAREQPSPKPSWLLPWEELSDADREVDRRIGETVFAVAERSLIEWLWSEDARKYTEIGPLIAKAVEDGRHLR